MSTRHPSSEFPVHTKKLPGRQTSLCFRTAVIMPVMAYPYHSGCILLHPLLYYNYRIGLENNIYSPQNIAIMQSKKDPFRLEWRFKTLQHGNTAHHQASPSITRHYLATLRDAKIHSKALSIEVWRTTLAMSLAIRKDSVNSNSCIVTAKHTVRFSKKTK